MNNEPVAWMVDGVLFNSLGAALNISFDIEQPCIPLYTHPHPDNFGLALSIIDQQKLEIERLKAKTLTDEEIKQIWYDLYPLSSSSYWDDKREGLAELKFARAILRKAQEK